GNNLFKCKIELQMTKYEMTKVVENHTYTPEDVSAILTAVDAYSEALTQPTEAEGWKAVELLREYRDMLLTPLNKEVPLKEVMKMGEWFKRVEKLLGSLPSNSNQ